MDLGEAIYRQITGRSPHTEVVTFSAAVTYLATRFGSATAAARASGFPPSSFRHWVSSGRVPSAEKRGDVIEAALLQQRRDRLPAGREKRLRRPGALNEVEMFGTVTLSDKDEYREVDIGRYMDDAENDLVDAYLEGATTAELAEIWADSVNDSFYRNGLEDGDWDIDRLEGWR